MSIIKNLFRHILYRIPHFENFILYFRKKYLYNNAEFSGWGLITNSNLPWKGENDYDKKFKKINSNIENLIIQKKFVINSLNSYHNKILFIRSLNWRHYIVFSCINFVKSKNANNKLNLVECGVDDGISAYYACSSLDSFYLNKFYLYDSWDNNFGKEISIDEKETNRKYISQDMENVKKNLLNFKDRLIFNPGYIPNSFDFSDNPKNIDFLHIDINSSNATLEILEFFYDKLNNNSIILFDDYGWKNFEGTKKAVDIFFQNKEGFLFQLPTGQAIYIR